MANGPATKAIKVRIENRTRSVYHIPVKGGVPDWMQGHLILGDREDTDDVVPPAGRDNKLQPSPVVERTGQEFEAFGPDAHKVLKDLVGQGVLRIEELAA